MNKNDERILELKEQINEKKKLISEKKVRFIPETNCILNIDGMTINLNVCPDDTLLLLLIRLNSYLMSARDLDVTDFKISGYSVTSWIKDIESKLDVSNLRNEGANLKKMENKLNMLLSNDKKTELEIDEIAALLK